MADPAAKGEDWVIDRNPSTESAGVSGGATGDGGGASASRPPQQQFRGSDEVDRSNLIVNYLPSDLTDEQLRALFTEFGSIESARVIKERGTGKSLGYGFIKYHSPEDAEKAVLSRNGYAVGGKRIKVSVARPASDDIKNCKLYVANLPQHFEKAEVVGLFCPFGKIIECRLLTDSSTGRSRNIAFVQFDSKQEATAALSLNGSMLEGSVRPLTVKHAEDQQQRANRLQQSSRFEDSSSYGPMRTQHRAGGPRTTTYDPVTGQMVPSAQDQQAAAVAAAASVTTPAVTQYIGLLAALAQTPGLTQLTSLIPALAAANPATLGVLQGALQQAASTAAVPAPVAAPSPYSPTAYPVSSSSYPATTSYTAAAPSAYAYGATPATYGYGQQQQQQQVATSYPATSAPPSSALSSSMGGRSVLNRDSQDEGVVLYVGNLPQTSDASVLHQLISPYAQVLAAKVITNKGTSICKGYGFVSVPDETQAHRVIQSLNGYPLGDRTLKVMFRGDRK